MRICDREKGMKQRNASIDIFRLICAMMVVAIHTGPLSELGHNWWYATTQILPRIGVPFFFCIMGYYYIGSLLREQGKFCQTMKRLLVTYGLWSFIYYIPDMKQVLNGSVSLDGFLTNCLRHFMIYGSREHFWFFPAVFFSIIVATIFGKMGKLDWLTGISVMAYILGLLGCSYYGIGNQIPVITIFVNSSQYDLIRRIVLMGFPFFMMGYFLQRVDLQKVSNKIVFILEGIFLIGFWVEILLVNKLQVQVNVIITVFLYLLLFNTMIILLKNPCGRYGKIASITRDISNFMYYSHPLFLIWINQIMPLVAGRNATGTELFLLVVISSGSVGYLLHQVDNKYLNRLFK